MRQDETNMPGKPTIDLKEYEQQMTQLLRNSLDYQTAHAEIKRASLRVFRGKNNEEKLSLTSSDIKQITDKLRDEAIEKLTVSNCGLDDSALIHIEELVRVNPTLRQINLSGNSAITNKGLNHLSKLLKERHPDVYPSQPCLRQINPMTFFKRAIFNIKIVGNPADKKSLRLSEIHADDMEMELAGRVFDQDDQSLIDTEANPDHLYTIKL